MGVTFLNAPLRGLTWKTVLFHLVTFPIAIFYFVLTVTGISLSIGLLVVVVGFFLGYGVLWLIHGMAPVEGWLVSKLLETPIRASLPQPTGSFIDRYKKMLTSASTWSRVAYVPLKLLTAVVGFGCAVAAVASLATLATPFFYSQDWFDVGFSNSWRVDALGEAILFALSGLVLSWVFLYLSYLIGRLTAVVARVMISDPTGVVL
jgi:Putative sensor